MNSLSDHHQIWYTDAYMVCWSIFKWVSVTRLNSLCPSDAIWWRRTGSTLAQAMACCLKTPSHYMKQCWRIISKVQWHSVDGNFTKDTSVTNVLKLAWKLLVYDFLQISQGPMSYRLNTRTVVPVLAPMVLPWWHTLLDNQPESQWKNPIKCVHDAMS